MGLTSNAAGAAIKAPAIKKRRDGDIVVALAGNPNVGKSTIFNGLTGMNQHTGNWTGKTVANACGNFSTQSHNYLLVDIPGTYSLMAHSAEEVVARDYICFGGADAAIVVCDAGCLERSLNLTMQVMELCPKTLVCVNLMDEAKRKGISIDTDALSQMLGVPVVATVGHKRRSLKALTESLDRLCSSSSPCRRIIDYPKEVEHAISIVEPLLSGLSDDKLNARWAALRLIEGDKALEQSIIGSFNGSVFCKTEIYAAIESAQIYLAAEGITSDKLKDIIVSSIMRRAEEVTKKALIADPNRRLAGRRADKILTSKALGYPIMLLLLMCVFWLTLVGANYPSEWLSDILFSLGNKLSSALCELGAPDWLLGILCDGAYRVTAWVVSVMLPPMAIFFPLFTILEDSGYLPRVAYNLDKPFSKCSACGKQGLTLCMGFGCNAAGIVGCRIIDSPRERLIAILTNAFVPCNGRFPMIVTVLSLFFLSSAAGLGKSMLSAAMLTAVILLGITLTFAASKLLSVTILKGEPSSFTLELPPYRLPRFGEVIIRSLFDRTLTVLGRAVAVAAPAGAVIWVLANVTIGGSTILSLVTDFIDPFAQIIGLDGIILTAFILGLPANEIVIPLTVMMYMEQGALAEIAPTEAFGLFTANGWTGWTAICFVVFALLHWPCSTSLLTIKKETGNIKWAALAALLPTAFGMVICALITLVENTLC